MRQGEKRGNQAGFTVIELFVVISIFGIMGAIALPVIGNLMPSIRLREGAQEVFRAMQLTRMEAIKRNKKVYLEFDEASGKCGEGGTLSRRDIQYYIYYLDPAVNGAWVQPKTTITTGFLPPGVALCGEGEKNRESTLWGKSKKDGKKVVMLAFKSDGLPGSRGDTNTRTNGSVLLGNNKGRIVAVTQATNGGIKIENRQ